jgi:hypothetical protein
MNSDQESNNKDIEDFLLFPMGIHAPPYDWQFKRYALSKLVNDAEILRWTDWRELTILNFLPRFKMKTLESLNTKHVDIFLSFPIIICVSYANKPSNGYGYWKT